MYAWRRKGTDDVAKLLLAVHTVRLLKQVGIQIRRRKASKIKVRETIRILRNRKRKTISGLNILAKKTIVNTLQITM